MLTGTMLSTHEVKSRDIKADQNESYAEVLKRVQARAEQGDADAQNNLGFMYREGQGVPQDDAQVII